MSKQSSDGTREFMWVLGLLTVAFVVAAVWSGDLEWLFAAAVTGFGWMFTRALAQETEQIVRFVERLRREDSE